MNCKKVLPYLHVYVDGEAAANLMRDIEEHLGACPECRGQAERIRSIDNLLDSLTVPPLPREFAARIKGSMKMIQYPGHLTGAPFSYFEDTLRGSPV
jgi:anti-sigma factor RsiW